MTGSYRSRQINVCRHIGGVCVGFQRLPGFVPRRFGLRTGGWATPYPWREFLIPALGSITISRERRPET